LRLRSLTVGFLVLAATLAVFSLNTAAAVNSPQDSFTLSFTLTTTSSYFVTTSGQLTVNFNSVQLDTSSPQAYAFGIVANAAVGFTITRLHWDFGDGIFLDVPYCCQSQVSEVRYHAYQQPGSYQVTVTAYDSGGNSGSAVTTISWATPVPEYPTVAIPLLGALLAGLMALGYAKSKRLGTCCCSRLMLTRLK
jgi:PKD repeat protein